MLFDAHCHAWRRWPYQLGVPDPDSRGSADALLHEMDAHGVERAAIIAARIGGGAGGDGAENADNNAYVARYAATHPDRLLAWVDVDCVWRPEYHTPGAAERLLTEVDAAGASGFTHYFGANNDGWLRSDEGGDLFATAASAGLIASLAVSAVWFGDLLEMAQENPTLPILIHHLGQPRSAADLDNVLRLAAAPNIGIKVSGFNYSADRAWDFPYSAVQERWQRIATAFGPHRLHWGSDFPASRDDLTYRQAIEVVRTHSAFFTAAELDAVLGDSLAALVAQPRLLPPPPPHDHNENEVSA